MAETFTLELERGRIELEITGYEFPEHLPAGGAFDYDANWLKLCCRRYMGVALPEGEEPCLLTVDVRRMIEALCAFRQGERTQIGGGGLEPNFGLELERRMDGDWLDLFFWAERSGEVYGAAPHFRRRIGREELDGLIRFWEQALAAFPVR